MRIENEKVVIQQKENELGQGKNLKKLITQIVSTNIPGKQYNNLMKLIYGEYDFLEMIFTMILMRINSEDPNIYKPD